MFFKCKLRDDGNGCLYDYVIVEGEDLDEAYDRAQDLPLLFGDATLQPGDTDPVEVANPLSEPWPIYTDSYFNRVYDEREARYSSSHAS